MRPREALSMVFLMVALCWPTSVAGGGFIQMHWSGRHAVSGARLIGEARDVLVTTVEEADRAIAKGGYFMYIQPGNYALTEIGPVFHARKNAILVGPVKVERNPRFGANSIDVFVDLRLPRLEAGVYTALFCDRGCRTQLGDLEPTGLRIVAGSLEERLRARVDNLRMHLRRQIADLSIRTALFQRRLNEEIRHLRRITNSVLEGVTNSRRDKPVISAEAQLDRAFAAREEEGWAHAAGWFIAGVCLTAVAIPKFVRWLSHSDYSGT